MSDFPDMTEEERRREEEYQAAINERLRSLNDAGASGLRTGVNPGTFPIYQGRPAGFSPELGGYSTSWTKDADFARIYAGPRGSIYTQQVTQAQWDSGVQRTASEGALFATSPSAHDAGLEEARFPQSFAAQASVYNPSPAATIAGRIEQMHTGASSLGGVVDPYTGRFAGPQENPGMMNIGYAADPDFGIGTGITPPARITGPAASVPVSGPSLTGKVWYAHPNVALANTLSSMGLNRPDPSMSPFSEQVSTGLAGINQLTGITAESETLGRFVGYEGQVGANRVSGAYAHPESGEVTMSSSHLANLQSRMAGRFEQAAGRYAGLEPTGRYMNVRREMYDEIKSIEKEARTESSSLERGGNPTQAQAVRELATRSSVVVKDMLNSAMSGISEGVNKKLAGDLQFNAQLGNIEGLREMITGPGADPAVAGQLASQVANMGGFGQIGVTGGTFPYTTPAGTTGAYNIPPGGGYDGPGGAGGGSRGGIWGGDLGSMMYGGYIARRFWSYTGAPSMRAMNEYANIQGGLEPMLTGEIPTGGAGAFTANAARAQYALGEGAYNLFGGIVGASSSALQAPGAGTLASGVGITSGLALGTRIMGGALGRNAISGSGLARVAGGLSRVAGPLALAGLAYSVGGAGVSAYEQMTGRDVNFIDMTMAAGQTVARTGFSLGMAGMRTFAGLFGQEDRLAQFTSGIMGSRYGQFLSHEAGQPMDSLASASDISDLSRQINAAPGDITSMLGGAYQITGQRGIGANRSIIETMNRMMQTEGMSMSSAISGMSGYASALGYDVGTGGFASAASAYGNMGIGQRATATRDAQQRAGIGAQFAQYMPAGAMPRAQLYASMGMFGTPAQGQAAFGGFSRLAMAGMGPRRALSAVTGLAQGVTAGDYTMNQMQGAMGLMGQAAPYISPEALTQYGGEAMGAFAGMSVGQQNIVGGVMGGDLGALSFGANVGMFDQGMALTNIAGQSMYNVDLGQGLQNLSQVAGAYGQGMAGSALGQLPAFQNLQQFQAIMASGVMGGMPGGGLGSALQGAFGVSGTMADFFNANQGAGLQDYQRAHSQRMAGFQQAGIGIGLQRIGLQRQFLYGGGDWRNPASDSIWGIQDRMRALQWQGQQASMQFSLESMDTSNQFAMQQEGLTSRRMGVSQDYSRWGFGFQRAGMDLSRQFTMENQQFQDQIRGMQSAFTLEDFDENIRMASGRQRRQLVQQRERYVSVQNVQDEQIDRQREQQQELWAREDEQFEKRVEYQENLMSLDEEQFNLNVDRRETLYEMNRDDLERRIELAEQLHELQEEMTEKQREFQVAQLDLSEKALGIQAAAAAAQQEYSEDMQILLNDIIQPIEGAIKNIAKYDSAQNILVALEGTAKALAGMNEGQANAITNMANSINRVSTGKVSAIIRSYQILMATSGYGQ